MCACECMYVCTFPLLKPSVTRTTPYSLKMSCNGTFYFLFSCFWCYRALATSPRLSLAPSSLEATRHAKTPSAGHGWVGGSHHLFSHVRVLLLLGWNIRSVHLKQFQITCGLRLLCPYSLTRSIGVRSPTNHITRAIILALYYLTIILFIRKAMLFKFLRQATHCWIEISE